MIEDLQGKVVLITGAGTGIGASAARAFGVNRGKNRVALQPVRGSGAAGRGA